VQQNAVREDGQRAILLSIIKNGDASTLAVVKGVRKGLQEAPRGLIVNELFDQAKLISASVAGALTILRSLSFQSMLDFYTAPTPKDRHKLRAVELVA
jgi:multidrug efflux pump subunit AcrB